MGLIQISRLNRDGILLPAIFVGIGMTIILCLLFYRLVRSLQLLHVPMEIRFSNDVLSVIGVFFPMSQISTIHSAQRSLRSPAGPWDRCLGSRHFCCSKLPCSVMSYVGRGSRGLRNEPMIGVGNRARRLGLFAQCTTRRLESLASWQRVSASLARARLRFPLPVLRERVWARVIWNYESRSTSEITLTPTLSRGTGRGRSSTLPQAGPLNFWRVNLPAWTSQRVPPVSFPGQAARSPDARPFRD